MKTVLFVCVHNAGRSQMAEAMLNGIASHRSLPVRAISAGTLAAGNLNPSAVQAMSEIGMSMDGHKPKLLNESMVESADLVISMGCGVDSDACPAKFLCSEDWGLDDPAGKPIEQVRTIRDEIRARVEELIDRMVAI